MTAVDPTVELTPTIPPVRLQALEAVAQTDVGMQREYNQDYFLVQTCTERRITPQGDQVWGKGLYILCDGMGGHAGGDEASQLATHRLGAFLQQEWLYKEQTNLPSPELIQAGVELANQAIYERNEGEARHGKSRMGTTLVLALVQDNRVAITHIGDSRLYRLTESEGLVQVTLDHEVGQWHIQQGVDPKTAYSRPDAYQLTQALGPRHKRDLDIHIQYLTVVEDTLFLLASDGMTDNELVESCCATHLKPLLVPQAGLAYLQEGCKQLIDVANTINGHDNVTVVLVRMQVKPLVSANP
ncbi:MAG: serine/threonine phosphatase [Gloeomargaritaceae cyanobacterium C42_A2020_066]|nr:serine/threonine phosphatase [Gloeomargaritaceae cyanobacterium C42_A2020_066]